MCFRLGVYSYICIMKNEITIPILVNDLKEKDLITAADHRKKYSLKRDIQAEDFNRAIVMRLAKDSEKLAQAQGEDMIQVKCKKCNKTFSVGTTTEDYIDCPECKQSIKVG
jgi:hypothetical protein